MVAIAYPQQLPTRTIHVVRDDIVQRQRYVRRRVVAGLLALLVAVALVVGLRAGVDLLTAPGATVRTDTATPITATVLVPDPAAFGSSGVDLPAGAAYVVQPGDTLWTIARALAPDDDVTATVARLRDLNGSSGVQVGQRLRLG